MDKTCWCLFVQQEHTCYFRRGTTWVFLHRMKPQELFIMRSSAKTAWYLRMLLKQRRDLDCGVHTLTQPQVRQPGCYLAATEGY